MLERPFTILHIAFIDENPFAGVNIAAAQHVIAQQDWAEVALVNLTNLPVAGVRQQFAYADDFDVTKLPAPFCAPGLVVFHELYRPPFLRISRQLRRLKIPYVIIPHGGLTAFAQRKKKLKKTVANLVLFDRFFDGAAAIQYLSQTECDASGRGRERIILPNGVTLTQVERPERAGDGVTFCFIGRLDIKIKGLDLLLEAVGSIKDLLTERHCTFEIYGCDVEGSSAALQEYVEKNGLSQLVRLHGPVLGDDKQAVLAGADCFVQPSRSEGMPMGVLEALGVGIPCLVSNASGLAAKVSACDAGWVCSPDAASIADCLTHITEDPKRGEKSLRAMELARSFSWKRVSQETVETYQKLAAAFQK